MQVAPIWKTKRSFKSVFGIKLSILCGGLVMKLCQLWRICIEDISPLPLGVNFVKSIRRTLYTLFGVVRKFLVYGHPWSGSTKLSRFSLLVSVSFCPGFCIAEMSSDLKSLLLLRGVSGILCSSAGNLLQEFLEARVEELVPPALRPCNSGVPGT